MEDDLKKGGEKEDDLEKEKKVDDLKKKLTQKQQNRDQSTKINLIGCDTIVN